jgi:hypothetical protein
MRTLTILIALAGCASEDSGDDMVPATLGTGQLTSVTWNGGPCPRDYHCSGALALAGDTFDARFSDDAAVAAGTLQTATVDRIAELVAAIPADKPAGVLDNDVDGPGIVELWIALPDETRVYMSNGFEGELGTYLYDLRDAIERCAAGSMIAAYASCAP